MEKSEPAEKRQKRANLPEFVYISCFDEPERLVEVSTKLLQEFNCRLYGVVRHQPPRHQNTTNLPFWRCSMTRAMLQTFVRSLTHGELSLSKGVSVAEALTTFEFENVTIGVPFEKRGEAALLKGPPHGAAFQKRMERVNEVVLRTSEQIASCIARWPRLEASLDSSLSGYPAQFTCTSMRAWVRFCHKPRIFEGRGDMAVILARKWPTWCLNTLTAFGIIHARLVNSGTIAEKSRDAESFNALHTAILGDPLGCFFQSNYDWPRHAMGGQTRRDHNRGERFANEIRTTILELSSATQSEHSPSTQSIPAAAAGDALKYAKSCISLADALVHNAPSPASIYSGYCCDDNGKSPERTQLSKSLLQRGIKVVRWNDDEKGPMRPLIFPPAWSEPPVSGSVYCAVLLDFSDRR